MAKPVEAILVGAGQRGAESYAPFALTMHGHSHIEYRATARQAIASHLMAFAAEQARLDGCVMEAETFR